MKKYIWISVAVLGVFILAPDLTASFATPFVSKGREVIQGLKLLANVLCVIVFVCGLIHMVLNSVQNKPLPWGTFGVVLVVSTVLGAFGQFSQFFGF